MLVKLAFYAPSNSRFTVQLSYLQLYIFTITLESVLISPNDMKGQRVASNDLFRKYSQNSPFYLPHFFFALCVVEMIDLLRSVISLGEAMYQSAFLSLEFRLSTGKNCACVTRKSVFLHMF